MASSLISQAALSTIEKGLNKLLAMDNSALAQLTELEGKVIAIQSNMPNQSFFIMPTADGLFLTSQCDFTADSTLTAAAPTLLQLFFAKDKQGFLKSNNLVIEGETSVINQFLNVFETLNPDWEYQLSQWFGPAIAGLVVQSVKVGNDQLQLAINLIQSKVNDFMENKGSTSFANNDANSNPLTDILGLLQKRFGRS